MRRIGSGSTWSARGAGDRMRGEHKSSRSCRAVDEDAGSSSESWESSAVGYDENGIGRKEAEGRVSGTRKELTGAEDDAGS